MNCATWTTKRAAWAFGCAKHGSDQEALLEAILVERVGTDLADHVVALAALVRRQGELATNEAERSALDLAERIERARGGA